MCVFAFAYSCVDVLAQFANSCVEIAPHWLNVPFMLRSILQNTLSTTFSGEPIASSTKCRTSPTSIWSHAWTFSIAVPIRSKSSPTSMRQWPTTDAPLWRSCCRTVTTSNRVSNLFSRFFYFENASCFYVFFECFNTIYPWIILYFFSNLPMKNPPVDLRWKKHSGIKPLEITFLKICWICLRIHTLCTYLLFQWSDVRLNKNRETEKMSIQISSYPCFHLKCFESTFLNNLG